MLNIGSFNVRGLTKKNKQESLVRDMEKYKIEYVAYKKRK